MSKRDWAIERVAALFRVHGPYRTKQFLKFDMAKLLKLERAWARRVVRLIKKQCKRGHFMQPHTQAAATPCQGYQLACDDILRRLR